MEEFEKLESLVDHTAAYAQTRIEETRLALAEKSARILALLVERSIIGLVFLVCILFISVAGAIALGEYLHHVWEGFLVIGGLYCIVGFFLLASKNNLIHIPVMNVLIRHLFNNSDDENN